MLRYAIIGLSASNTYQSLQEQIKVDNDGLGMQHWVLTYPLKIYTLNLYEQHTFKAGSATISQPQSTALQQKWKYFIMTRSNGTRYYCTSFTFYQQTSLIISHQPSSKHKNIQQFYLPKCLVVFSQKPYFKLMINLMRIYKQIKNNSIQIPHSFNKQLPLHSQRHFFNRKQPSTKQKQINYTINQIFEYYLDATNNPTGTTTNQKLYISTQNNKEILHVYTLFDSIYQFNYFMHLPISGQTLLQTICAVLLEKQIIFVSRNSNVTLMLMETLLQIIMPLQWVYMYVPILPQHLLEVANQCFLPYMIGINQDNLADITKKDDKIIVNIDENKIIAASFVQYQLYVPNAVHKYCSNFINYHPSHGLYRKWQQYIRVQSLMMISEILHSASFFSTVRNSNANESRKNKTSLNILRNSQANSLYQDHKTYDEKFYAQFINKTAIFQRHQENQKQPVQNKSMMFQEIMELTKLPQHHRYQRLLYNFRNLEAKIEYPAIYHNENQWHKYCSMLHNRNIEKQREKSIDMYKSINSIQKKSPVIRQSLSPSKRQKYGTNKSSTFITTSNIGSSSIFSTQNSVSKNLINIKSMKSVPQTIIKSQQKNPKTLFQSKKKNLGIRKKPQFNLISTTSKHINSPIKTNNLFQTTKAISLTQNKLLIKNNWQQNLSGRNLSRNQSLTKIRCFPSQCTNSTKKQVVIINQRQID